MQAPYGASPSAYATHIDMHKVRLRIIANTAGALQRVGLINYRRGNVTVKNRRGLERRACECYGVAKREFDRLLGNSKRLVSA